MRSDIVKTFFIKRFYFSFYLWESIGNVLAVQRRMLFYNLLNMMLLLSTLDSLRVLSYIVDLRL